MLSKLLDSSDNTKVMTVECRCVSVDFLNFYNAYIV